MSNQARSTGQRLKIIKKRRIKNCIGLIQEGQIKNGLAKYRHMTNIIAAIKAEQAHNKAKQSAARFNRVPPGYFVDPLSSKITPNNQKVPLAKIQLKLNDIIDKVLDR